MKTKFSPILKIKQLEIQNLQNEILKLQNQKKTRQKELEDLKKTLVEVDLPKQGDFLELNKTFLQKNFQKRNIELKKQNILFLSEQIKLTEQKYKEAMLEYEKIKYLHDNEIEKKIKEKNKQEAKELDEIGNLLFSRKSKK